ncbi:MAG: hypothetical protein EZS28_011946 [Streblomastix strix]|uniref:Uncharacterized protein n=1 Tax=Streblomastix strix TaxID=222440 RepID=A0A5J4WCB1_9EUKA|nr:MAG: hypothetical protein EZS28_011946 [Streblomastix strix]
MFDASWYNNADIVPYQITSESDTASLADSGTVSTAILKKNTAVGRVSNVTTFARSDHVHYVNFNSTTSPRKDTSTDKAVGNVPFVNAAAASNRYSDYYC